MTLVAENALWITAEQCGVFETASHQVAQAGLELTTPLP
jgi:hypothetical protein